MRRLLGVLPALLLVPLLLAGCGDDDAPSDAGTASDTGSPIDPSPSATTISPTTAPGDVAFEVRDIVDATAAGGENSDGRAVEIASPDDVEAFTSDLSPELADLVAEAVAAGPAEDGESLYAAVVGLGCDVPTEVDVVRTPEGYAVTGRKVPDPLQECFAPVTTVAVLAIEE